VDKSTQPDGYLALPPNGKGKPVLVLHPWWGLNETIKGVCTLLAEQGFTVFGADLYHGKVVDTIPDALAMAGGIFNNLDTARAEVATAIKFLSEHPAATSRQLAVVGFSMGGFFALDCSNSAPDVIRSVVIFYATGPSNFSASKSEYLGHFAETDPEEPEENVVALEQLLKNAGRPFTFYRYPGTGHWFFEPDRVDAYNPAAANLAWERTLAFLKRSSNQ
jgi:carboxymethylenebutenolidase